MKKFTTYILLIALLLFHPGDLVYAFDGEFATFSFEPLHGKAGENEVKLVVNTDDAFINHLIFDIADPSDDLVFDLTGSSDPVLFPLNGDSVLGTETPFTTASGDVGYDLASANPANTASYTNLHFATLVADKNLPEGAGGVLSFDSDTAIYVSATRQGVLGDDYTVLPNAAPVVSSPTIDSASIASSNVAPSASTPLPESLAQNVSVNANFAFAVSDSTDASVARTMKIYKRNDDDSWTYPTSPVYTKSVSRSGTNMTFSQTLSLSNALDYSSYYKLEFIATDDQGASDTETYYFSTQADNTAPNKVSKAKMTFISDDNTRTKVISQISFTTTTDNDSVANYYLWTKAFLVARDILNSDGTRDLALDTNNSGAVSDAEFNVGLRALVSEGDYLSSLSAASANTSPYFSLSGNDVDGEDAEGNLFVPDSLSEDIFYVVAADASINIAAESVPNFSEFKVVEKIGDVFGAEVTMADRNYMVGDGSLDVWDAVYLYRNITGLTSQYPVLEPDNIQSSPFTYPANISTSSTTDVD